MRRETSRIIDKNIIRLKKRRRRKTTISKIDKKRIRTILSKVESIVKSRRYKKFAKIEIKIITLTLRRILTS